MLRSFWKDCGEKVLNTDAVNSLRQGYHNTFNQNSKNQGSSLSRSTTLLSLQKKTVSQSIFLVPANTCQRIPGGNCRAKQNTFCRDQFWTDEHFLDEIVSNDDFLWQSLTLTLSCWVLVFLWSERVSLLRCRFSMQRSIGFEDRVDSLSKIPKIWRRMKVISGPRARRRSELLRLFKAYQEATTGSVKFGAFNSLNFLNFLKSWRNVELQEFITY